MTIPDELLTEQSNRLLDTSTDKEYLETDEYALAKARQEDMQRTYASIGNKYCKR